MGAKLISKLRERETKLKLTGRKIDWKLRLVACMVGWLVTRLGGALQSERLFAPVNFKLSIALAWASEIKPTKLRGVKLMLN